MTFTDQKVVLVQSGGGRLGELRFKYGCWHFLPFDGVEITGEQNAKIAQQQKELDDNER